VVTEDTADIGEPLSLASQNNNNDNDNNNNKLPPSGCFLNKYHIYRWSDTTY